MLDQPKPEVQGAPAANVGSSAIIDVTAISATATMDIHRYFLPRFHEPGWKLAPAFHRRNIGIANATYKPTTPMETTAKNATGTGAPLMSTLTRAGAVSTTATTAEMMTP